MKKRIILAVLLLATSTLVRADELKVTAVDNFDLEKYLGVWYEIARIENSFEEGLTNVTATYSIREDGKISVVNRGFEAEEQEWDVAESYGDFAESADLGHIEVTFFWPFYVDYIVFEVDSNYQYAFVTSDSTEYLWLLARKPKIEQKIIERFLEVAKENNFKIDELVFVPQDMHIKETKIQNVNVVELSADSRDKTSHKSKLGKAEVSHD